MAASCMESVKNKEKSNAKKKQKRRNLYDKHENEFSNKKVSFKERLRRSFRLKRSKTGDGDELSGNAVITRSNKQKLNYIFRSFRKNVRKNVRKPVKILRELPDDTEVKGTPIYYEHINGEIDGDNTELTDDARSVPNNTDSIAPPETTINNIASKDTTARKELTSRRSQKEDENELTSKTTANNYPESIISTYNMKTRYFLSKLFNIKKQLYNTKNVGVLPEDKYTVSCSRSRNGNNSGTLLQHNQAMCHTEKNGYDHFRSSIIISLNDDNGQKRSSILISLNDKDHLRPSYLIPLNDNITQSRSSTIFQLGDDMDLSYLIEYANQAFDGGVYNFENSRDIMGGSESNILELDIVSPLYNSKRYENDICRSYDLLCSPKRVSVRESLHLGDDDEVVIANGPDV